MFAAVSAPLVILLVRLRRRKCALRLLGSPWLYSVSGSG